ncbi:hypothetical protein JOQ06_003167, partial [Pogonophryne albipinna]
MLRKGYYMEDSQAKPILSCLRTPRQSVERRKLIRRGIVECGTLIPGSPLGGCNGGITVSSQQNTSGLTSAPLLYE